MRPARYEHCSPRDEVSPMRIRSDLFSRCRHSTSNGIADRGALAFMVSHGTWGLPMLLGNGRQRCGSCAVAAETDRGRERLGSRKAPSIGILSVPVSDDGGVSKQRVTCARTRSYDRGRTGIDVWQRQTTAGEPPRTKRPSRLQWL